MPMHIQSLHIYPIKSLAGISVLEAAVTPRGLQHDRRFMLTDPTGKGITQRTDPQMALLSVTLADDQMTVSHRTAAPDSPTAQPIILPLSVEEKTAAEPCRVSIWADRDLPALRVSDEADAWFSVALGRACRLVFMPDSTRRAVEVDYALSPDDVVSFADAYPMLLVGQGSLDELNRRLDVPLSMSRFRPNVVVDTAVPHEEDHWHEMRLGGLTAFGVKPCARCVLTTVDPDTGEKGREPLRTLATYRRFDDAILFGQNVLTRPDATGLLRVGDAVTITDFRF
jgi:uncharacterized protein